MNMLKQPVAVALTNQVSVIKTTIDGLHLQEVQMDFEEGTSVPAKSISISSVGAKKLRDFLNEQYPKEEVQ
jgi:hypothetical protein